MRPPMSSLHTLPEERPLGVQTRLESPTLDSRTTGGRPQTQGPTLGSGRCPQGTGPSPFWEGLRDSRTNVKKKKKTQNKK